MSKINWIHLSDWHQKDEGFDRTVVRDALVEDIEKRKDIDVRLGSIDFIIFSGDLTFSGTTDQYETAINFFLQPILKAADISPDKLFIVPGNHDLNRAKFKYLPSDLRKRPSTREDVNRYLEDCDYQERLLFSFKEFKEGINEYTKAENPEYAGFYYFEKDDANICIFGLNSALFCARVIDADNKSEYRDRGNLVIGEPQFVKCTKLEELKEISADAVIRIAVVHHPINYLNDDIDNDVIRRIPEHCDFLLSGHTHKFDTKEIKEINNTQIRTISAGASYDRRKESNRDHDMSYNFVHLDLDTNQGTIFYRRWDDPNWGAYLKDDIINEGKVAFTISKGEKPQPETPETPEPPEEPEPPIVDVERYRTWLRQETEWLDFRPFFPDLSTGLAVLLKDLYFDIKIKNSSIEEIVKANPRILLEGKPGSGKSTILQYLALVYTQNKGILPLWFKASSVLSFINQKRLNTQTKQLSRILVQFWCEHHEITKESFNEDWLVEQMRQGKVLFLMDGLDELFEHSSPILRNIIDDVVKQYDKSRWVITCLSNGSTPPQHFKKIRIDPFSDEEIVSYIDSLTEVLMNNKEKFRKVPPNEEAFKHDVIQMVFDHLDSIDFFRSPLTLTVAICLYWSRDNESRLEMEGHIYEYALKLLFGRRIGETSFFPLKNDMDKIRKCLQVLVLDVYADKTDPERYFEGPSECLAKITGIFDDNSEKAQELIEWEESVSGLTKRDTTGSIGYQNKAILLYLAACELAERFKDDDQQSKETLEKHFARENENWQKIISFIPIIISQKKWGGGLIKSFIAYLLASRENDSLAECVRVIGGLKNILFYIRNFDINPDKITGFQDVKDITMGLFKGKEDILPREKYNAAIAIGFAGDPRFEDPSSNWVFIPGGQARIGATTAEDDYAKSDENPAHIVYTAAFEIGKYPVTVEEYLRFMEAGGYTNKNFWDTDGLEWLKSSKADKPRYWQELQQFKPNCPVVYVCYHEANAYCKWLSSRNDKYLYQLPTEAQWEYVARRGKEKYEPYVCPGITPDSLDIQINWDNVEKSHIRNVCPVGMYPLDATKDDVRDMNGNISEWTATPETKYSEEALQADKKLSDKSNCQMVRGGSFRSSARDCRTARRTLQFKEVDNYDLGFRVVRIPKTLPMKGIFPANDYTVSFGYIFARYSNQITDSNNIPETLKHFPWFNFENIPQYKDNLYPDCNQEERKQFKRRPVVLGDYDGWEKKLAYNLRYQDSQVKVAVERKIGRDVELAKRETDVKQILEIIAYIMNSKGIEHEKLWMDMTDGDLDGLVLQVLSAYDEELTERLVTIGIETNKIALAGLLSVPTWETMPTSDFVQYQVFAGTMWWTKCDEHNAVPERARLEIKDIELFRKLIKNGEKQLIVIFDDNGELVWDLAFILRLLNRYPKLQITAVVNKNVIYNNACMATVRALIDDEESPLHELDTFLKQKRFVLFEESCYRTSIDPKYCSKELLALLTGADLAFIKGSTGFETMQNLPVDTYYAFVSWGADSRQYTNVEELKGLFVRVPKGRAGYEYPGTTLKELYEAKQLSYFKLTKQSFEKLRDEHIPKNVLEGLKLLENKEIISKEKFLGAIEKEIGKEQTVKYKELVLKHVSSY